MVLNRILLGFDLLFAIACLSLFGLGVFEADPNNLLFVLALVALFCLFIGSGMRLSSRGRYAAANIVLGVMAAFSAYGISRYTGR